MIRKCDKEIFIMATKQFKMTAEGKAELEKELDFLKTEGRIDEITAKLEK